jgi:NAD(P)-dependent dehydrogenase (short-subunit alcohol dehydrogenase family)
LEKAQLTSKSGGSSGIGLATVELLVSLGASVVSGDIQAPPARTSWTDLTKLFKAAKEKHGRLDYVFANAGIGPRANYLALDIDENGDPKEPNRDQSEILNSVINTATLGVHQMKEQTEGGSIVIMGSSTG